MIASPLQSVAQTQSNADAIRAELAQLQARITVLMNQLQNLEASSDTTYCSFSENLTVGVQSLEVVYLQKFLKAKGYYAGEVSNYFGLKTQAALQSYQISKGISPATGYFGPMTRAVVNADCKNGSTTTDTGLYAPNLVTSFVSSETEQDDSNVTFRIDFKVKSSLDTIYVPSKVSSNLFSYKIEKNGTTVTSNSGISAVIYNKADSSKTTNGNYEIEEGEEEAFSLTVSLPKSYMTSGNYRLLLSSIKWDVNDVASLSRTAVLNTNDFRTNYIGVAGQTTQSVSLLSPNGGEAYKVGDSVTIRWSSTNMPSNSLLYLQMQDTRYLNNGDVPKHYSPIPNYQVSVPNTGSYTWTIPETLGNGQMKLDGGNVYKLSIGNASGQVSDWSNSVFSITKPVTPSTQITVTSQNTSSGIAAIGDNLTVSFDTSRTGTHSVFLVHSATGRATDLGTYNVSRTGVNSFTRTLATSDNLTEGSYRTRVCYGYGNSVSSCDDSSSTVQIKSQTLNNPVTQDRFVSVTNPNTGGSYEIGDSMNISWNHAGFPNDQKVTIALFKNGNHEKTIASNVAITDRSYPWVVPSGTYSEGNVYKIYVGATSVTGTRTDYSDTAFSIKNKAVEIVSPKAGTVLTRGAWYMIRWENLPLDTGGVLDLYVVSSNGTETKITSLQANQASSYQWTVPATFTPDSNVKIKVYRQGTLLATSGSYSVVASAAETAVNKSLTVTLPSTTFTKPNYTDGIPVTYSWTSSYPVNRLWFQMIEKTTGNIKNAGFAGSFETGAQSGSKTNNIPGDAGTGTYVFKLCDVTTGGVSATSICDTKEFTLNPPTSPTSQTRENQLANIAESIKKLLEELKKVSR